MKEEETPSSASRICRPGDTTWKRSRLTFSSKDEERGHCLPLKDAEKSLTNKETNYPPEHDQMVQVRPGVSSPS